LSMRMHEFLHTFTLRSIGDFVVKAPMVIGHESSGVVQAVGRGVTSVAVGDRVALEPGAPCWHCKAAREGRCGNRHLVISSHAHAYYTTCALCAACIKWQCRMSTLELDSLTQIPCSLTSPVCTTVARVQASAAQNITVMLFCHLLCCYFSRYNLDPDIQFFTTPRVHGSLATFVDHPAELFYKLPASLTRMLCCYFCRYNLDSDIQFFATPPVHGSLATFVDHPAELCYKLPASVTLEEGAMCETLSVGVHACRSVSAASQLSSMTVGQGGLWRW
jgi:threonine dehydrogenase-like Zn-dependent dehydrogenase